MGVPFSFANMHVTVARLPPALSPPNGDVLGVAFDLAGVLAHPLVGGKSIIDRRGVFVFGRFAILDGDDHAIRGVAESAA